MKPFRSSSSVCGLCPAVLLLLSMFCLPLPVHSKDIDVSKIYGKIKFVDAFPDYKVQVLDSFADLDVKIVDAFPDGPGKWQIVDAFPDFKIQIVDAFPDFKIRYVSSFPGTK